MQEIDSESYIKDKVADHDSRNLAVIERARAAGRINDDAARYLGRLYADGMGWFREMFYFLGKCFGAPKAPVMRYDYKNDSPIEGAVKISDINPLDMYMVHHRLDADPMRNQFFNSGRGHKINLAVSSIVTVIVGAQKNIDRALDKITGKYYNQYTDDVCNTIYNVLASRNRESAAQALVNKVRVKMTEKYITSASELVLSIIGRGHEGVAVEMVRALDKITPPYMRLRDVWRVKCLFDLIPQARTFIERVHQMMPERVLFVRDSFYDIDNPRNYRDAKLVINIGTADKIVPMEIICQVRAFFDFEMRTHGSYEVARSAPGEKNPAVEQIVADLHEGGVKEYNLRVCRCLDDLFERVGWNILYHQDNGGSLFDGFPRDCTLHYPAKIYDTIMDKLDNALENEVFHVESAPAKLTQAQESKIFHYMARFVLVSAMPYMERGWAVPQTSMSGKLFNFVMNEVQRYYKKRGTGN